MTCMAPRKPIQGKFRLENSMGGTKHCGGGTPKHMSTRGRKMVGGKLQAKSWGRTREQHIEISEGRSLRGKGTPEPHRGGG